MPVEMNCKIVGKEKLNFNTYKYSVKTKEISEIAQPRKLLGSKSFR